jgi:DNA modification methylase
MTFPVYKEISISSLKKYTNNSRVHSEHQIQQIINSIKEFGFTNPILVDENNQIIAGHCRLEAAKIIGLESVPCVVLSHLTDAQKKAYVIADNKLALNADWDIGMLIKEFESLKLDDFNLELTGFSIEELIDIFPHEEPEVFCDEDDCPDAPEEPIAKLGDVWLLGEHRLMCGDSTVQTDVDKLLNKQLPNTMITDPPYGVKYEASWRAEAKGVKKTARETTSSLQNDDRSDWYDAYVLFPGSVAYVWHASAFTDVVMDGLRRAGFDIKQQIIWNKNIHALSRSDYHWKHEPCWYAVKKGYDRNWKGDRKQMTVWDIQTVGSEKDKTSHPTQKPVEIYTRSIHHHTNPGEYIYDPFGGSGTLLVACEKSQRRALLMELDPKFCDVIIKRYENYTGKKAVLEE